MRRINVDALVERPREVLSYITKSTLDLAPTIDAVIVVRCRDCAFAKNAKWNKKGYRICPASHMEITDDDFCSYGVRKEEKYEDKA